MSVREDFRDRAVNFIKRTVFEEATRRARFDNQFPLRRREVAGHDNHRGRADFLDGSEGLMPFDFGHQDI